MIWRINENPARQYSNGLEPPNPETRLGLMVRSIDHGKRARVPAILGGDPTFADPLHVGRPDVHNRTSFLDRIQAILTSRRFTNDGPMVEEFEDRLCEFIGTRECVVVNNGTTALRLLFRTVMTPGEVILPSFTFVATAHALQWEGFTPVFCDIETDSWTIDPECCSKAVNDQTVGLVGVHVFGTPCDTNGLAAVARKAGISLLFDAAHAFGCSIGGTPIGRFGVAEVFSLHATKVLHSFEGGAIATDDVELARTLRRVRNFGFDDYDLVGVLGINAKMPEVCAAMGLANLESLDEVIELNRRAYQAYDHGLREISGIRLRPPPSSGAWNWHYIVAEIDEERFGMHRDLFIECLHHEGILARRYFYPGVHSMEPYRRNLGGRLGLPNTNATAGRVVVLPGGISVGESNAIETCEAIQAIHDHARQIALTSR
ncbi:aminotransferase class I/II-fold pyridoxal phosphate-dependent enzyme [candidate division GN15 bacterium]|nr:aminotransferase class I/II-fold pyridoxal phosphate-dependent enzyme [candidate division GN15 bacterium]